VVKGVNFANLRDAGDPVELAAAYDAAGAPGPETFTLHVYDGGQHLPQQETDDDRSDTEVTRRLRLHNLVFAGHQPQLSAEVISAR
jgi:hypothetical protein